MLLRFYVQGTHALYDGLREYLSAIFKLGPLRVLGHCLHVNGQNVRRHAAPELF
jgi:hypothetical protein